MVKEKKWYRYHYSFDLISPEPFENGDVRDLASMFEDGAVAMKEKRPKRTKKVITRQAAVKAVGAKMVRDIESLMDYYE